MNIAITNWNLRSKLRSKLRLWFTGLSNRCRGTEWRPKQKVFKGLNKWWIHGAKTCFYLVKWREKKLLFDLLIFNVFNSSKDWFSFNLTTSKIWSLNLMPSPRIVSSLIIVFPEKNFKFDSSIHLNSNISITNRKFPYPKPNWPSLRACLVPLAY